MEHLLKTAYKAKEIASGMDFEKSAFYAGLLHDIGKLNPYYQILFSRDPASSATLKGQVERDYVRAHSIFSALALHRLLNIASLPKYSQKQALFAVAGHHSKLTQFTRSLAYCDLDKERFQKSYAGVHENLLRFSQTAREIEEFKELSWETCLRNFKNRPKNEANYSSYSNNFIKDFLDFSSVFSALIQADRGSFFDWQTPDFNVQLDTTVLVRTGFPLSDVRNSFQEKVLSENNFQDNISILQAPTGIGKTKIFLDIVNKVSSIQPFERVFYFSPLLALTDDFEGKLFDTGEGASVLEEDDAKKVLVYNYAFVGSLLKKRLTKNSSELLEEDSEDNPEFLKTQEYFERESFNKELIITTTQRLLMVLYSNEPSDKEKLLSFKNSFLIIDEVQTIPKVTLSNLVSLLKVLAVKYNSRILLVSATIPDELKGLPMMETPKDVEKRYLQMTAKRIEYQRVLDAAKEVQLLKGDGHTLFMFNTRRKASNFFEAISQFKLDTVYLSSGIRKSDRSNIIRKRLHEKEPATVVSTQVLEAGVDVSFSRMYREMAPLDNIVQAMGRLNREGETSDPLLSVFIVDDGDHLPYSELEVNESKTLIPNLHSSVDLYEALPDYYHKVSSENLRNKNLAQELDTHMKRLNFEEVWAFIKKHALPIELGDSMFVPTASEWDVLKHRFLSLESSREQGKLYKQYAELMAALPRPIEKIDGLEELLDEDLLNMGVLLPKKEAINEVYDSKVGLDKWVKK